MNIINVQEIMEMTGLNQTQLGEIIGIRQASVSTRKSAGKGVSCDEALKIASVTGISVWDIRPDFPRLADTSEV